MIFHRKVQSLFHQHRFSAPLVCALFLLLMTGPVTATAAEQNTAFLPLKINSFKDNERITSMADVALLDALSQHDLLPVARNQAETIADYTGSWPPPPKLLQDVARLTGFENVAAGSLTMIGSQLSVDMKVFDLLAPSSPQYFFRKAESIEDLPTAIEGILLDILAYTGREFRIASISPKGNKRIDSGAILRKISSKAGGSYNQATLREDLKAIYSMGYFNDVQIDVTDGPQGKDIIFTVVEKPVIASVTFTGADEVGEEDVRGAANIREHFTLNPAKIDAGKEAILELYKSKGFYNTQVTTDISYPTDEGAVIEYTIDEGSKVYIKEISFEGNTTFDDDELRDEIESGEKGFFSWLTATGLLEMDKIRQDAGRIVTFYQNNGFLETKIGEPQIRQEEDWLYITFSIEEGPRFKVGTVKIEGDVIADQTTLLNLLSIRKQEYLNRSVLREDMMSITDYYAEQGYAFANVRPLMEKSSSGGRIDISFDIDQGELVYVNRITIKGNNRTRDNVIRRELRIAEGGVFNSKALRDSSKALQRLQYFEEVNVTPEPTMDPSRMNIAIDVKERSTGTFSVGAGYSSVDDLIIMGSISENNFLGRGDKLSLSANLGGSSSRYNLAYTNPHVNDSDLSWGLDLFDTEREYDDYTKDSMGGGLRVGYPLWEKWKIYGNYSYTDTDLTDVDDDASYIIRNSVDLNVTSAIKATLVRDTRDKLFGATEGSRHQFSVKYGGGPLGGDAEFTKYEASTSWYFPLVWKTTFHFKGALGQVDENETDKLPVYERFYLGGMRTIRGFEYGDVSPIDDETGERIGGEKMWYTNFEIIFPIAEGQGIQGLVFFDAGQSIIGDWSFDDYEKATGLGIRWFSPMGPISIVWGYNLDPRDDEESSVFDFSIGGTF
ncbi:outer membrane protein assembly factor BamA [Desulfopila sp. IMCC35008]|uniref:outer membrane protein assembly factor BamA n=1 Tax=Desulfopila sp. IMCC35008 TaxID=2653858 RepID=UPI0013D053F1|nr:outer membrane protein assembly factor BamA [Desulfopila sp. IMCC35008]